MKKIQVQNNASELRENLCNFTVPFVSDVPIVLSGVAEKARRAVCKCGHNNTKTFMRSPMCASRENSFQVKHAYAYKFQHLAAPVAVKMNDPMKQGVR